MTASSGSPGWYLRRLSRMGPREIGGRAGDAVRRRRWRSAPPPTCPDVTGARFTAVLPAGAIAAVPPDAAKRLVAEADRLMAGHAVFFGVERDDLTDPDWWYDPKTGRRAPGGYAFDVPYRDEDAVGDIKQIWEPSRHQYLTVLAAAYAVTGDERYAERVAGHLRSWWAANGPLRGVHWTSGIELGIRLLSWVWIRRLLDGWPGAAALFEDNPVALNQIWHHQRWLAAFPSRGSSANNHVIAEAAGQLAAACAFGWFPGSARLRAGALRSLERELRNNTFGSGLNRELATEYHGLVLELGLAAVAEADAAGVPVPRSVRLVLLRMTDALAAVVDDRLRPPRQGDADDGHGLVVDGAGTDRWGSLLATGDAVFGRLDWWPEVTGIDVRTPLLAALIRPGADALPPARTPAPGTRPRRTASLSGWFRAVPGAIPGRTAPQDQRLHPAPGTHPRRMAAPALWLRRVRGDATRREQVPDDTAPTRLTDDTAPTRLRDDATPARLPDDTAPTRLTDDTAPTRLTDDTAPTRLRDDATPARLPDGGKVPPASTPAVSRPVTGTRPRPTAALNSRLRRMTGGTARRGLAPDPAAPARLPDGGEVPSASPPAVSRPASRPGHFADAGLTVLRGPEGIWCRCDGGPHGFLSIAAHAHADALSVEVRHDGVDVLADPGTYCYHGQPEWRRYFRSTLGHNTLELDGEDQSVSGGPFLWTRHARSRVLAVDTSGEGVARWSAEHDGYGRSVHRRRVELHHAERTLRVVDEVRGPRRTVRLAFHLGPAITADLVANRAVLTWTRDGEDRSAELDLPGQLSWRAHRGESEPPLGWYSPGFGRKEPATTLVGTGLTDGTEGFTTVLGFKG
ncbi:heparinase II/III family protein [Streptomyces sp. NPDC086080]|uniref:alginate lyase family protein n=1 Tax=Streptomyces sp. NPDC086080 TaxID=3365748 RepID=UPI0037D5F51C